METPTNLNLRQTIEGMTLAFNPQVADGLEATIQFDVSGAEPGLYHLRIANGDCTFHVGVAETATLTIETKSDVWLKISQGELSGPEALMQGLYNAQGDLSLMLKMGSLFKSTNDLSIEAPAEQRPAGPIPLAGMTWINSSDSFVCLWSLCWG